MFNAFVIFLPLFVTLVLSVFIAMELLDEHNRYVLRTKVCLLVFVVACVFLYLGHATYFMCSYESIPLTDSLYCFCSPAVYPLYYIYVCELSNSRSRWYSHLGWLVPPLLCGLAVTVCYLLMSANEQHDFINTFLYENSSEGLSGYALASVYAGLAAHYWTSSLGSIIYICADKLCCFPNGSITSDMVFRYYGLPVRPVCP